MLNCCAKGALAVKFKKYWLNYGQTGTLICLLTDWRVVGTDGKSSFIYFIFLFPLTELELDLYNFHLRLPNIVMCLGEVQVEDLEGISTFQYDPRGHEEVEHFTNIL